jgi:hypothetical protein
MRQTPNTRDSSRMINLLLADKNALFSMTQIDTPKVRYRAFSCRKSEFVEILF